MPADQRVPDLLARVVDRGGVQDLGEVEELVVLVQDVDRDLLGAGVVDDVRRVAGVEPRLELAGDLLGAGVGGGDPPLLLEGGLPGLGVGVAVTALEDDDVELAALLDAEGVRLGGLALAFLGGVVAAAAAGTRGQEAHRRDGNQAERGGTLDQIAAADTLGVGGADPLGAVVVLSGSGSHAQVLAFSRTQAVNRILPAPRSVQAGSCVRIQQGQHGGRRADTSATTGNSPQVAPARSCATTMRTPTGIVHFPPEGQDRMQGSPSVFSELRPLGNMSAPAPPDRKIPAIRPGWRTQHP